MLPSTFSLCFSALALAAQNCVSLSCCNWTGVLGWRRPDKTHFPGACLCNPVSWSIVRHPPCQVCVHHLTEASYPNTQLSFEMDSILHRPESKSSLLYSAVRAHCPLTHRMCLDCSIDIWVTVLRGLRHTCGRCSWEKCNVKRSFSPHRAPCFHSVGRLYTYHGKHK